MKQNKTKIQLENLNEQITTDHAEIKTTLSRINSHLENKISLEKYTIFSDQVNELASIDHIHALEDRLQPMLNDAFDKVKSISKDHTFIMSTM